MSSMFGLVVPGRPIITEFQQISETKAVVLLDNPSLITEVTFFLLQPSPIGFGAMLYYSVDQIHWEVIGAIDQQKPSGIFSTSWQNNEAIRASNSVFLGVSLESLDTIKNLQIENSGYQDRFNFAHKIALDLFQYMASFSQGNSPAGMMVVPNNIFDRWLERFERKYKLDPNFMLRNNI